MPTEAKPELGANVFVARQPIFDPQKGVYAYELLFRSGMENRYTGTDADASTLEVIASSLLVIGLDEITGQKRGFINFTRNLLLQEIADLLPPSLVTIEILEDVQADEEVIAACWRLKKAGYMLALDDFVLASSDSPLLDMADIVKICFVGTTPEDRKKICADLAARKIKALAEKVETIEDFNEAVAAGYEYFQGYFFAKPIIRTGHTISGSKLSQLRMLQEVNKPELSYDQLQAVIKQDVSLTYNLMKFINSAWFGLRYKITSIKHALVLLGPKEIRKWFALVTLRHMGVDKPSELLLQCMTRAWMGELMAPALGMEKQAPDLFLMGMFSVIDALLDAPMAEIVAKLPLNEPVQAALLGQPGQMKTVLDAIIAYERGDWPTFGRYAKQIKFNVSLAPAIYGKSLKCANDAFSIA